jgi:CRP-like cAMP-binding protein
LLSELSVVLREQVIDKAHAEVYKKIDFFQHQSKEFNKAIVPELKPVSLGQNELLYQQGETAEELYFIHSGRVKLWIDANDSIKDEELLRKILDK